VSVETDYLIAACAARHPNKTDRGGGTARYGGRPCDSIIVKDVFGEADMGVSLHTGKTKICSIRGFECPIVSYVCYIAVNVCTAQKPMRSQAEAEFRGILPPIPRQS